MSFMQEEPNRLWQYGILPFVPKTFTGFADLLICSLNWAFPHFPWSCVRMLAKFDSRRWLIFLGLLYQMMHGESIMLVARIRIPDI